MAPPHAVLIESGLSLPRFVQARIRKEVESGIRFRVSAAEEIFQNHKDRSIISRFLRAFRMDRWELYSTAERDAAESSAACSTPLRSEKTFSFSSSEKTNRNRFFSPPRKSPPASLPIATALPIGCCPICLRSDPLRFVAWTNCGRSFCRSCHQRTHANSYQKTFPVCPLCRTPGEWDKPESYRFESGDRESSFRGSMSSSLGFLPNYIEFDRVWFTRKFDKPIAAGSTRVVILRNDARLSWGVEEELWKHRILPLAKARERWREVFSLSDTKQENSLNTICIRGSSSKNGTLTLNSLRGSTRHGRKTYAEVAQQRISRPCLENPETTCLPTPPPVASDTLIERLLDKADSFSVPLRSLLVAKTVSTVELRRSCISARIALFERIAPDFQPDYANEADCPAGTLSVTRPKIISSLNLTSSEDKIKSYRNHGVLPLTGGAFKVSERKSKRRNFLWK